MHAFAGSYLRALGIDAPAPAPPAPPGRAASKTPATAPQNPAKAAAEAARGAPASLAREGLPNALPAPAGMGAAGHALHSGRGEESGLAGQSNVAPSAEDLKLLRSSVRESGLVGETDVGHVAEGLDPLYGGQGEPDLGEDGDGTRSAEHLKRAAVLEAEARRWDLARKQLAYGEPPPEACNDDHEPNPNPNTHPGPSSAPPGQVAASAGGGFAGRARDAKAAAQSAGFQAAAGGGCGERGPAGPPAAPEAAGAAKQPSDDQNAPDDQRSASSLAGQAAAAADGCDGNDNTGGMSAAALGALQALLEAVLVAPRMPTLHDVVAAAGGAQDLAQGSEHRGAQNPTQASQRCGGAGPGAGYEGEQATSLPSEPNPKEGSAAAPAVRWYDARARVALRRAAAWLRVPSGKLATLERMAAQQAQARVTAR